MRPIVILTLIPLLLLCPILCGAAESDCASHLLGTWTDPSLDPDASDCGAADRDCCPLDADECPQDAGDCLCMGAVQADGPQATDGDHSGLHPSLDGLPVADHPASALLRASPARPGCLIGCASLGGERRALAMLQVFRC